MGALLDIDIRTPDWPGPMESILGEVKQLRESNALLEKRQAEIEAELSLAARVQQSLAPRSLAWNGVSVESHYRPAHMIGGDFGIVFPHGDEALSIVICDVSGHGIGSALMANRVYSETLHQLERGTTPGNLLRNLHDFARLRLAAENFYFTMAAVRFSLRGRQATFAAGGHPPAMHVSKGGVRLLESQDSILGSISRIGAPVLEEQIELAPGDRLLLYTDGLIEAFNSFDDMLGVEGLERLVLESSDLPSHEFKETILDAVTTWRHGPLADDVSLVIAEIR